jgi:hypothetical protein
MAAPKPIWLPVSMIPTNVQEWLRDQTEIIIPDFYIWTRKNGWAQTKMIIPDFCIWKKKND